MAAETLEVILKAKDMASGALASLRTGMERLSEAKNSYQSTLDRLRVTTNEFRNTMTKLAAVVGVAGVARSFIEINASAEKTKLMLAGLMGSTEMASEAFDYLLQVSTRAPFTINAMSDAFVKLQVAGLDPMHGSLETLMDAVAAFGGTEQELQRAAVAMQQMAGKGVVSMEELRQQLGEAIPTAMQAMADGLGMTMEQLVKEIESGNIAASEGLNAMMSQFKELYGGTAQQMMNSWAGLISNLKVAWQQFALTLGETGVFDKLKDIISGLLAKIDEMKRTGELKEWGDRISTVVTSAISLFTTLASVLAKVMDVIGTFLPALIQMIVYFKTFQVVLGGLIGLPLTLAAKFFALKSSMSVVSIATQALSIGITKMTGTLTVMDGLLRLGIVAGAAVAGAALAGLAWYVIWGRDELDKYNKTLERTQEVAQRNATLSADLSTVYHKLGITQGDLNDKIEEFHKLVEEGVIVFNEATKQYERVASSAENLGKTYKDFYKELEVGSEQFIAIKNKELATLKSTIDYEIALEEQRYKTGEISFAEFLTFKERRTQDYVNRILYLLDMELELLNKAPEENLAKIAEIEEKKKQIVLQSKADQLKTQKELNDGLKGEYKKDLDNWEAVQELKLQSLERSLDLQNTIEETMVEQGLLRQSQLLENQLDRWKQFQDAKVQKAEEAMRKIAETEGIDSENYRKAYAERESLQGEIEAKIIASEAQIANTRKREELDAAKFIAEVMKDQTALEEAEYQQRLDQLERYYTQGVISAEEYYDALDEMAKEHSSVFKAELRERSEQLNQWVDLVQNRLQKTQQVINDFLKSSITDVYADVKQYWGDASRALSETTDQVVWEINHLSEQLKLANYDAFWNAQVFGKRMIQFVGESVYEWMSRVTDYINYVKGLMQSLQDYIMSLRMQLAQLRDDRLAELELWYAQEKKKIEEQYKDLINTQKYYDALALLLEIYKEKKAKILEQMEEDEAAHEEKKRRRRSGSGGAGGGGYIPVEMKYLLPDIPGLLAGAGADIQFQSGAMAEKKDIKFELNLNLDSPHYDPQSTERWVNDTLFPILKRKLRLMGLSDWE